MLRLVIKNILFVILCFCFLGHTKIEQSDFQKNFNIAKQHLSQRRINKALPYLLYLQKSYPKNANLKYLVGLCYAETEVVNPETLKLLTEASLKASIDYDPNSLEEKRVPIYVYYYLSIAYAQNGDCEQAEKARDKFLEVYPHKDEYYIDESKRWLKICFGMKDKPTIDTLPSFPEFEPYISPQPNVIESTSETMDSTSIEPAEINLGETVSDRILTKPVEFTTDQPLYGVQLGAFKEAIPVSRFKSIKNIDAFMDKDGLIRYVVGHFSFYAQAESLLKYIREQGFEDAYVVNVNNEKKYTDEVVSVNDVNIKAVPQGTASYKVQVGAFMDEIPEVTAQMYFKLEGIEELRENKLTYLVVGDFKTYNEAKAYLEGIKAAGINDAFVIALSKGKKISLKKAEELNN
ncbi:MAG: SPOR domain-containing protein [Vicingaceae bacterium]